jgi:hypothetical protein
MSSVWLFCVGSDSLLGDEYELTVFAIQKKNYFIAEVNFIYILVRT